MATDLVDQLLAQPGVYAGSQRDPAESGPSDSVARIVVTALPGSVGVTFDYEVLRPEGSPHTEHAVLARTASGLRLFTAHNHAPVAMLLEETEPGYFLAPKDASPFPMAIRLEVPEKNRLVYTWSYGEPGGELQVRDVGDLKLLTP